MVGRTRATNTPTGPPAPSPDDEPANVHGSQHTDEPVEVDEPTAKVIPLPVFDARKEAEQWRF